MSPRDIAEGRQAAEDDPERQPPTLNKPILPVVTDVQPPKPLTGIPFWKVQPPAQLQNTNFGPATTIVAKVESGTRNIRQIVGGAPIGPASGFVQIEDATWRDFARQAGVNLVRYPTAMSAPAQVQAAVAARIPLRRWARPARDAVLAAFPWADENMTLGQIDTIASKAGRQRYILASNNRDPADWGKAPTATDATSGPGYLPTRYDVPAIMDRGRRMQPMLSQNVGIPNMLMLNAWAGYQQAQQGGQLLDMFHQATSWKQNLSESKDRMEEEAIDMSSAWAAYSGDNDPTRLTEAMTQIAGKYNDAVLGDIVDNPDAIQRLMHERDKYFTDVAKTELAQQKSDAAQKIAETRQQTANTQLQIKQLELQQKQTGGGSGFQGGGGIEGGDTAGAAGTAPAAAKPPAATAAPQGGGPPGQTPPAVTEPPGLEDEGPEGDQGEEGEGEPEQEGEATPPAAAGPKLAAAPPVDKPIVTTEGPPVAPGTVPAASSEGGRAPPAAAPAPPREAQAFQYNGRNYRIRPGSAADAALGQALTSPEGEKQFGAGTQHPDQIMVQAYYDRLARLQALTLDPAMKRNRAGMLSAIGAIDGNVAGVVQGLLERRGPQPAASGMGSQLQSYSQLVGNLARSADPTWYPGVDKDMAEFRDPNKQAQVKLGGVATMAQAAAQVLGDVRDLERSGVKWDATAFQSGWNAFLKGTLGGPEQSIYRTLYADYLRLAQEENKVVTGRSLEQETEQQFAQGVGPIPANPKAIREGVVHGLVGAYAQVETLQQQWDRYGANVDGVPTMMFGRNPQADAAIWTMTHMDTSRGTFKTDAQHPLPPILEGAVPYTGVETR